VERVGVGAWCVPGALSDGLESVCGAPASTSQAGLRSGAVRRRAAGETLRELAPA
jgi:hypothetical protein